MKGRIVFVMLGKKDYLSGGYVFNFRMVEALESAGYEVDIVHFRTVPPDLPLSWPRASLYVYRRIIEKNPDLVVVSKSYQYLPLFRISGLSRRVPVLFLMHHLEWVDRKRRPEATVYRRYVKWLLGMADRVWTNSANSSEALVSMGVPPDMVRVIPPGFEKTGGPPPRRRDREGPVRLLCVGSVSPRKSQHILLQACTRLEPESFFLNIVGSLDADPEYAGMVENLVGKYGLKNVVRMSGVLEGEDLRRAYDQADLLVHPAVWEAFGMSIVEGMWRGLPVVASDVAAVPELVRHGENGVLVRPGDVEELAAAIRSLVGDADARLKMGAAGRRFAESMNDWNAVNHEFLELVTETMETGKGSPWL